MVIKMTRVLKVRQIYFIFSCVHYIGSSLKALGEVVA